MKEEPAADAKTEKAAEPAEQDPEMFEEMAEANPILKRKMCCKKANKSDCKAKNPVCAVIAIAAACCTVLAAAGCAAWFLSKCCEEKQ